MAVVQLLSSPLKYVCVCTCVLILLPQQLATTAIILHPQPCPGPNIIPEHCVCILHLQKQKTKKTPVANIWKTAALSKGGGEKKEISESPSTPWKMLAEFQ